MSLCFSDNTWCACVCVCVCVGGGGGGGGVTTLAESLKCIFFIFNVICHLNWNLEDDGETEYLTYVKPQAWASYQIREIVAALAPGMAEHFHRHRGLAIPTGITARALCLSGSLTSGFFWSRWRGKHSRHSRRMRNPQFYVTYLVRVDYAYGGQT